MTLTAELLRERLLYLPETGEWFWSNPPNHNTRLVGKPAGYHRKDGYRFIRFGGVSYKASRLAFVYMTGKWPENEVDHINRVSSDDRWENLRDATSSQNKYNRGDSSLRGVYRSGNRWFAAVGRNNYLGVFDTLEEAVAARDAEAARLGGMFAVLNNPERVSL